MSKIVLPEIAEESYKEITDETVTRLHEQISNITSELEKIGYDVQQNYVEGDVEELKRQLESVVSYSSFVDSGTIVELDGEITGFYPAELKEALRGQNFSDREYVQKAIKTKNVYISNVVSAVTGRFVVVVAIPILDQGGEVTRVVNFVIRISENPVFNSIIQNIEIGDGYAYIVDRYGRLLSHPEQERIGEDVSSNEVVQAVLNQQSGYQQVLNSKEFSMLASYEYIPVLEWGVIAQVPESYIHVYFKEFQDKLIIFSIILFLFLSFFVALYTRKIIKPIQQLEFAVGELAQGKFSERISDKYIDQSEIGRLAKRFNEMTEYMAEANENIETKEQLLLQQKEFLRKVIDSSPNFIYAKNKDGFYTLANQSLADFYGTTVEEMLFRTEQDFNQDVVQVQRHEEEEQEVIKTLQERYVEEEEIIDENKQIKWLQTTKIPLQLTGEKDVHVLCISNDITDRKLAEEIIRKSDKLSAVGELAAGVAHEIRNPLTSIQGFLQFIKPNYKEERYFDIMLSEIERIKLIISEMLVLSKPQVEKREMKDVTDMCQRIIDLFESQANLNNIQIQTNFEQQLPEIWCEENQLKQVFVNILKNAMESMTNGGEIFVEMKRQDENMILIRFIDQGIGIEKERLKRIGEPFYSTKEKGTGLGLMVSYRIIESHHGKIKIDSKLNKGTTIDLLLPIQPTI
ncbi:two-component sensor histidine kinase [Halalkalibacter wakoensis JCM 9140]|uniref:histidine kinase n=2 Tax=Halalkalibacter wakoensis TaxID=127891 RepID=W4Q3N2_9BACI|nr:two-component sensor histidine kinase [Halalkalibacter wakoensis JCM 9140]